MKKINNFALKAIKSHFKDEIEELTLSISPQSSVDHSEYIIEIKMPDVVLYVNEELFQEEEYGKEEAIRDIKYSITRYKELNEVDQKMSRLYLIEAAVARFNKELKFQTSYNMRQQLRDTIRLKLDSYLKGSGLNADCKKFYKTIMQDVIKSQIEKEKRA